MIAGKPKTRGNGCDCRCDLPQNYPFGCANVDSLEKTHHGHYTKQDRYDFRSFATHLFRQHCENSVHASGFLALLLLDLRGDWKRTGHGFLQVMREDAPTIHAEYDLFALSGCLHLVVDGAFGAIATRQLQNLLDEKLLTDEGVQFHGFAFKPFA